jgi:predicted secreted Zn-dependent protease
MKNLLIRLISAGLALLALPMAQAEYREQVQYAGYDVKPRPGQGLFSAVQSATPFRQEDGVFQGYTASKIKWSFQTQTTNGGRCRISAALVEMDTVITLPVLHSANAAAQREFAVYLEGLRKHEHGHLQLNQAVARQLEDNLLRLPGRTSCQQLIDEANALGNSLMATMASVNAEFDRRTQHGAAQGVVLSD